MSKSVIVACHAIHHEYMGGAFKLAGEFAEYLAQSGIRVHFVCGSSQEIAANPVQRRGISIWRYPFPTVKGPGIRNLLAHLRGSAKQVRMICKRERVVCLNGHSPLQFLGAANGLGATRANTRMVYSVHSPFAEEYRTAIAANKTLKKKLAVGMAGILEKRIYRISHAIQCDSAYSAEFISEAYRSQVGTKATVVPGWVDLDRFGSSLDRDIARARLGGVWDSSIPIFLSVRRLERRMGLGNLVEACRSLRQQGFEFRLILGGTGPLREELQALCTQYGLADHVSFLGRIPDEDLPDAYAAADCFVLPTQALECFGLIVLEAHASGTPVIATPVGAIPEVMGRFRQDWLTDDASAESLTVKMRLFLENRLPFGRNELRTNAEAYRDTTVQERLAQVVLGKRCESPSGVTAISS